MREQDAFNRLTLVTILIYLTKHDIYYQEEIEI